MKTVGQISMVVKKPVLEKEGGKKIKPQYELIFSILCADTALITKR